MTSSPILIDSDLETFKYAFRHGNWDEVVNMYKERKELRTAYLGGLADTALHEAVWQGEDDVVESMVDIVMNEDDDDKNLVLAAKDVVGNTPLHIAATRWGRVKHCEKIGGADPLLIAKRNNAGETPLFRAVLDGQKEKFLLLHYKYMSITPAASDVVQCITRDDQENILHIALENKRIDLALEIVLLYKGDPMRDMTGRRNRNGFSPFHLLAETPDLFQSTDLSDQYFIVRLLYHCLTFIRVKKEKATTMDELKRGERKKRLRNFVESTEGSISHALYALEGLCWSWCVWIVRKITCLLFVLLMVIPLGLPLIAEHWFHMMRDMKEKHTWSLQILQQLLDHASYEDMEHNPYEEEREVAGSRIIDTPLMVATKNGMIEMVRKILLKFPITRDIVNEEGKNIVLLAAEKRQTKVYQFLYDNYWYNKDLFEQVDNDGNTALHLAVNPNWKTNTLDKEIKWFEFVKNSVPHHLREKSNKDGKSAEEIFRVSYEKQMESERQWLNQSSQACSVVSSVVASVAFSNVTSNSDPKTHISSLVALFMSLSSTIILLAILSVRSQSLNFWKRVPFMLQTAISLMIGSIASLWISLMLRHGKFLIIYASLGSIIVILSFVLTIIVIGPAIYSMTNDVPPPNRSTATSAIRYRKKEKPTPTANDSLQDTKQPCSTSKRRTERAHTF